MDNIHPPSQKKDTEKFSMVCTKFCWSLKAQKNFKYTNKMQLDPPPNITSFFWGGARFVLGYWIPLHLWFEGLLTLFLKLQTFMCK